MLCCHIVVDGVIQPNPDFRKTIYKIEFPQRSPEIKLPKTDSQNRIPENRDPKTISVVICSGRLSGVLSRVPFGSSRLHLFRELMFSSNCLCFSLKLMSSVRRLLFGLKLFQTRLPLIVSSIATSQSNQ